MMSATIRDVPLSAVLCVREKQPRKVETKTSHVNKMILAMDAGIALPPVIVCRSGVEFVLYDGFHRVAAHVQTARETISAEVFGTALEATIAASLANANGLPWTREDAKVAAAEAIRAGEFYKDGKPCSLTEIAEVYALHGLKRDTLIRYVDNMAQTDETLAHELARIRQAHGVAVVEPRAPMGEDEAREFAIKQRLAKVQRLLREAVPGLRRMSDAERRKALEPFRKYLI